MAKTRNQEYAETLNYEFLWDSGAPYPTILSSENKSFLLYYLKGNSNDYQTCVVEFSRIFSHRFGVPNDEVHQGHPLFGKGHDSYRLQEVINSRWIEELKSINSVHDMFSLEIWTELKHFIFWFHDTTFECIAQSFKAEQTKKDMEGLVSQVSKLLY